MNLTDCKFLCNMILHMVQDEARLRIRAVLVVLCLNFQQPGFDFRG